jgi:sulfopyruvate decarboxylase alpha subunit
MTWESDVVDALVANDVTTVAYLPDSAVSSLVDRIEGEDRLDTVRLSREEEGVGVLAGAWLGHGRGALVCQSSGLATTINALASLSVPARIPLLALVTRRGDLDEFNAAQVPFGYGLADVLDTIGVRNTSLEDPADAGRRVGMATRTAFSTREPYAVLLESTLTGAKDEF